MNSANRTGSPPTIDINQALAAHHRGDIKRAEELYRQILQQQPNHADALHLLGVIALQARQPGDALELIEKAVTIHPDNPEYQLNRGLAQCALGRMDQAQASMLQAIAARPGFAAAHFNLATVLQARGRVAEAADSLRRALKIEPRHAEAHNNLGGLLEAAGQLSEAAEHYRQALSANPTNLNALNNLGNLLRQQDKLSEARQCFDKALTLAPGNAVTLTHMATLLQQTGAHEDAVERLQELVDNHPENARAHYNLGNALAAVGHLDQAVSSFKRAIDRDERQAGFHNNLGSVLFLQGELAPAAASFRRALALEPSYVDARDNLADASIRLCDWSQLDDIRQNLLQPALAAWETTQHPPRPFLVTRLPMAIDASDRQKIARAATRKRTAPLEGLREKLNLSYRLAGDRLRIGYVSTDFNNHATAHLIHELLAKHDRDRFEVFGYSIGSDDGSEYRRKMIEACDTFRDVRLKSSSAIAKQIAEDGIGILIDLNGYSAANRIEIFALRPAPVQATYLAFPSTTGAGFLDYLIADAVVAPADQQTYFDEKLVHLPHCYQVNSRRPVATTTLTRAECGLPQSGVVFCCFNNHYKIEPVIFDVWARILHQVPGSVLWLLAGAPETIENLRQQAAARDLSNDRLVFAERMPPAEHLARHRLADLFLDTYYYNAHTTASDALWAGLPVLTCPWQSFASRVGKSIVGAAGMPEMAVSDMVEYETMAVNLAKDADRLAAIKSKLARQRDSCPLFDIAQFARDMDSAYTTMWENYQAGNEPRPFSVAASTAKPAE